MILQKIVVMVTLIFLLAGCAGMSRSEQNILGGGVLGAGLGAAIGAATGGNPAAGAAIGGAAGVVGGALMDSRERGNGYYGYDGYGGYPPPPPQAPPQYWGPAPY